MKKPRPFSRDEYRDLVRALDLAESARACIRENRGYEKDQASQGYEHAVHELTTPLLAAMEVASGDLEAHAVERARTLVKALVKEGAS